ncbi:MAG: acyl-CoA thioesterase [Bradymonadia bacterium]
MSDRISRPVAESQAEMTQLVLPPDTNHHGTIFGGRVLQWIDIAAGISAQRHCRQKVVTAAIDEMHFNLPIKQGDIVILRSSVNFVSRSSMEIGVRVERESPATGRRFHAATAYLTFVALDGDDHPVEVPMLTLLTDEERRRWSEAEARRAARLERRAVLLAKQKAEQ